MDVCVGALQDPFRGSAKPNYFQLVFIPDIWYKAVVVKQMVPYHESRQMYQTVQTALCFLLPEAHSQVTLKCPLWNSEND